MSLNQFKDNECLLTTQKHCPCVEFVADDGQRFGFQIGQLLHYRLQTNDAAEQDAPPEKLTLAFATADVTLVGWRLDRIADHLRDGDLLAVRSLPARYANLDQSKCAVVTITVEPIGKTLAVAG